MANTYAFGQSVIPRLRFRDRNEALVDVTGITVDIAPPVSPPYTYTTPFDHPSTGIYEFPIDGNEAGIWRGEACGVVAGDGTACDKFVFCVESEFVVVES